VKTSPGGPSSTSAPYVPVRSSAWPRRRMPRWLYLAGAGCLVIAVAIALVHTPSRAERASDLRGFLAEVTGDIQSCAGGVGESLQALHEIQSGAATSPADVSAGISIAQQGAANCSPANNELLDNLENYQVPESLDQFRLKGVVTDLIDWAAPDARDVQTDVASVLSARSPAARSAAQGRLTAALATLDKQRTAINTVLDAATKALAVSESGPRLPG
jgi:hypothetical protein